MEVTSLASSDSRASLADQLLKQALETGRRRAQPARALGLREVELLLIDQRGSIHRPMPMVAPSGLGIKAPALRHRDHWGVTVVRRHSFQANRGALRGWPAPRG